MSSDSEQVRSKLAIAKDKKELGNQAFKAGDYKGALRSYHEAILYVQGLDKSLLSAMNSGPSSGPADGSTTNEDKKVPKTEADVILLSLYNNMAAIHLKNANWKRAMESANKALAKDEDNVKAAFRKAQAQVHMGERLRAIKVLEDLSKKHPDDLEIARELTKHKAAEADSEKQHNQAFKSAWKGKFSFNRDKSSSADTTATGLDPSTAIQV